MKECRNCKYWGWINTELEQEQKCSNGESDRCADTTDGYESCDSWEEE